ncbi:hypothetical protein CXB51_008519 [Gossypium anomalum]|uniref:RNase H type-1 domain-containing protein n=1 Tax=Gossypium anomalum TaxID=47600 RepID=A0A8J5YXB4_9ROSI|nr:hypothetical protein CXB51_008519 [Gossypium anomalum]
MEILGRLIERVSNVILVPEVEDQLLWAHDSKGEFSVKQLSKLLLEGEGDDSIFAFDRLWKLKVPPRVNNFEEFYSLCFKVKFVGSSKSLWLIAMAASCWSIWLARNEIVLFKSGSRGWCFPPHGWLIFNVSGTTSEGASGCGGMMRDAEGSIRALFSGPCDACDADTSELGAVITTLDIFIEFDWVGGSLIVEMGSRVVYNWVLDKTRRPWSKQATFADLERRIACVGKISFSIANINGNEMAETLATAGMSKPCLFKA